MKIVNQNILEVQGPAILAQQVNTKGVMGAGLALQIRDKWPIVYKHYTGDTPQLGQCQIVEIYGEGILVANLAGQRGYGTGKQTNYGGLSDALNFLRKYRDDRYAWSGQLIPTYFPYGMGCGLAGGDWKVVSELIEYYFPEAIICKI